MFQTKRFVQTSLRVRRTFAKISYKHNVGKEPLKSFTLGNLLDNCVKKYPEKLAIISREQNRRLTFLDYFDESYRLASGFRAIGLIQGDRVGLWAPNMTEWLITNMACARLGLIVVALNPAYRSTELEYCINKVGIKALVCPKEVHKYNFHAILNEIGKFHESEPGKLNCEKVPSLKSVIMISDEVQRGFFTYRDILEKSDEDVTRSIKNSQHLVQITSPLNIQFTSGTTGNPKAAVLSHFNVVNNSYFIGQRNELGKKDHTICVQVPFFHAFGYTITASAALNFGATMVIPSSTYSPLKNLQAIAEEKCSIVHGTPTMYVDLISKQNEKQLNITPEIAVSGGSPCPPQLFRDMKSVLKVKKVKSVYGLTETTAVVFQSLPEEDESKSTDTVGHLCDHIEAKIVDENGLIVPVGEPGELCVRGYSTMFGYWEDEAKTKDTLTQDWWLKTGDQFVLTEDGYGKIVGRLKDMIIRGGENIYPKEIEDFLVTHPEVLEVHVVGLKHPRLGEEVCACIKIKEGSGLTEESLLDYCKGKIADFKIPSQIRYVTVFPTTQSGKIQKYLLKKQIEEEMKK